MRWNRCVAPCKRKYSPLRRRVSPSMNIYWLEQSDRDLPAHDGWLSLAEKEKVKALKIPKRRAEWRLGRWTAKVALATHLRLDADPVSLARVELRPAPSGAPVPFISSARAPLSLSLSHRDGRAMCVIAPVDVQLGCDLESIESHSDAFAADYFTQDELNLIDRCGEWNRDAALTLFWSLKESGLKALQVGLRWDTRSIIVLRP